MKHYKAYLIDLDGTMYKGTDEIDGAAQFIDYLNQNNIPHLYVTNNSTKTPDEVTEKLRNMKIDAKPDEIVTSALATADYISEEHPNASVYMLGGNGLKTALTQAGLTVKDDEHVDYVVIGLTRKSLTKSSLLLHLACVMVLNLYQLTQMFLYLKKEDSYQVMVQLLVLSAFQQVFNLNLLGNQNLSL